MILGIGREAGVFLYAALSGLSVWAAYGILSCFRKIVSHRRIMISLEDIVFWIGASVYIFRKMYDATYGTVRWFFVLGALCGAGAGALIFRLVGKILVKVKKKLEKYRKTR